MPVELHLVHDHDQGRATGTNPLYDPAPGLERPSRPGPVPDPAVFCGLVGESVARLDPTTEADPVGVLVNLMSAGGAYIGPGPFLRLGDDRHPALIWALTVGATAAGRKGAATATAKRLLAAAVPEFLAEHAASGLSSGEGLIEAVKDEDGPDSGGTPDKRLWLVESEYGITMIRARREGSSLGGVLRQAWNGEDLAVMNRQRLRASHPHIALIGHISPFELRSRMQDADLAGGTYNRFLPVFVHRTLLLPESSGAPQALVNSLAEDWRRVLKHARTVGEVELTEQARQLWRDEVYPALSGAEDGNGPLAEFTARAAPYAKRCAMVYALLDGKTRIDTQHLYAAWALVRYARASAAHILGAAASTTGDPRLDKLCAAVRAAGPAGLSGTQVQQMFKKLSTPERSQLTADLCQLPGYAAAPVPGGGRHGTVFLFTPGSDT
jgi:hypothetical protein